MYGREVGKNADGRGGWAAVLLCCLALSGLARAGEHRFALYLDTDANAATGCTLAAPNGAVTGVEQVLTTVVTTSTTDATVSRIERQVCSGGSLGAASVLDPGSWSAGIGNGSNGTAAIETAISLSLLPTTGTMRVTPVSTNASGGQDETAAFAVPLGDGSTGGTGTAVPAPLSALLSLALALAVLVVALGWRRRHPQAFSPLLIVGLALLTTLAGAVGTAVMLDGNVGDWAGVSPAVTSPQNGPVDADLLAVYWQKADGNLYFRIDADVEPDTTTATATITVSAGTDQTITLPNTAPLNGSATRNPAGTLTLAWTQQAGPGTTTFGDATQAVTTAAFDQAGIYVLKLTASDGTISNSATTTVTVNAATTNTGALSLVPVADRSIVLGTRYQQVLQVTGTASAQSLTYTLPSAPTGAALNPSPLVDWTPDANQLGTHAFTAQVTDGTGDTATTTFHVTVTQTNHAPVLAAQPDETVAIGANFTRTLMASDLDAGDTLTFALVSGPAGMTLAGAHLMWTANVTAGDYAATVKVSDAGGLSDTRTFTLHVLPAVAPVAHDDEYSVRLGDTLTVAAASGVLANDYTPPGAALTANKLSEPDKGTLNTFNAAGSFTFTAPPTLSPPAFKPVVKWSVGRLNWYLYGNARIVRVPGRAAPLVIVPFTADYNGFVAFDGATGEEVWEVGEHLVMPDKYASLGDCQPDDSDGYDQSAIGDIDDSGVPAIVTAVGHCSGSPDADDTRMLALSAADGSVKWISDPLGFHLNADNGGGYYNIVFGVTPVIARLHAGETPTVLLKRAGGGYINRYSADTEFCSQYDASTTLTMCTGVIGLDGADGTVRQEWVAPADYYQAYGGESNGGRDAFGHLVVATISGVCAPCLIANGAVWGPDGNLISNWMDNSAVQDTAVVKLGDGAAAIVSLELGGHGGLVARRAADASVIWKTELPDWGNVNTGALTVGDLDGDGLPEIVTHLGPAIWAFDRHGQVRWVHSLGPNADSTIEVQNRPVIFDLDGDGEAEVVYQWGQGPNYGTRLGGVDFLHGNDGTVKTHLDFADMGVTNINSATRLSPLLGDIDGSGHASLVFGAPSGGYTGTSYVYALAAQNNDWRPTRPVFGGYDYHVADINDDGSIPQFPLVDNFETPATNVFGTQPQIAAAVDPRKAMQTSFTYAANANGLTSAPATVTINLVPQNRPPVFVTTPPTTWLHGQNLADLYHPHAVDPDVGDTVTYSVVSARGDLVGCTIDATSGAFTPASTSGVCQMGDGDSGLGFNTIIIAATDSQGATTYQTIQLRESGGTATVPDVVGKTQADATSTLAAADFGVGSISQIHAPAPAGQVLSQYPSAGGSANLGSAVDLTVSLGPPPTALPNVVGLALPAARQTLAGPGFTSVVIVPVATTTAPEGEVLNESPAPGTLLAPPGPVTLKVSSGPPLTGTVTQIVVSPGAPQAHVVNESFGYTATAILADGTSADVTIAATWSATPAGIAQIVSGGDTVALAPGNTTIKATLNGVSGTSALTVVSFAAGDQTGPVAQIDSPGDNDNVTAPTDVTGTASDAHFLRYELALAPAGTSDWTTLATGTSPVSSGTLGKLDPTARVNGAYTLRLAVFDAGGNETDATIGIVVMGQQKPGLFTLGYVDLNVAAAGTPITVTRSYDSRDKTIGDFGIGWRLGVNTMRVSQSTVQGNAWRVLGGGTSYALVADRVHSVSVTLPDGHVQTFDLRITPNTSNYVPFSTLNASYVPEPGMVGTLQCLDNTNLLIADSQPGVVTLLDDTTLGTFDPKHFRYTNVDGTQFEFDATGVTKVTDARGNSTTFSATGITSSSGQSVAFARDSQNRITAITDPSGRVQTYTYDVNGDLVAHTTAAGGTSKYAYDYQHDLISAIDPDGNQAVRNTYDAAGHLVSSTDAAGHTIAYSNDPDTQTTVVTDRLGNVSTIAYDADGNVTATQTPVTIDGSLVLATTTSTYDSLGNALTNTNPDGIATQNTWNGYNPLTQVVDPSGLALTTSYAYDANDNPTRLTDAGGHATTMSYLANGLSPQMSVPGMGTFDGTFDGSGNLATSTDSIGTVKSYSYDSAGNETRADVRDASSNLLSRTDHTYDANGNKLTETVWRTVGGTLTAQTTTFAYDASNRLVATTDALGNVSRTEYDAAGRVTAQVDALGRRTTMTYDALGRLVKTTYPDGSTASSSYDANGNVLTETDPAGRVTSHAYDELGREVSTTTPGGSTTQTIYSAGGRVDATIDANGNRTDYAYDSAGRQVSVQYPAVANGPGGALTRPQVTSVLNASGQPTSLTDANGNVTQMSYDGNGKLVQTTLPDGHTVQQTFDAVGRRTSTTNEEGQVTNYSYDGLGRLVAVSGLNGSEQYTYDEAGNLLTQTDALGHVTQFSYDALGRLLQRTYPGGETEQYAYDAIGNVVAYTDGLGRVTSYAYDAMDRLTRKVLPGGATVTYTYAADGQRTSVTDARGTTSYAYDAAGRLATQTKPNGAALHYAYDGNDNLTELASPAATVAYQYDANDRLAQVTAPTGTTTSAYDLAGNRLRLTAQNGIVSDTTYDVRNRPIQLTHKTAGGTLLRSYAHTYSPASRLMQTTENDGSVDAYSYDAKGRLAAQTRTGTHAFTATHTYDAVGNRTQTTRGGTTTTYSYDSDDRLVSDGDATYAWDANGNLASKTSAAGVVQYAYDPENRLVSVLGGGLSNQYVYDDDGNRVQATNAGGTVNFLVDDNNPTGLSQVLEERDASNTLQASYVFGDDLVGLTGTAGSHVPLGDGSGSVTALTDASAAITDAYWYDAHGNPVAVTGSTVNPYRYRGERLDADTVFYQLRARYYDPVSGRFMARDPLSGEADDPASLHRYLYGYDDPVDYIDPTGEEGEGGLAGLLATFSVDAALDAIYTGELAEKACALTSTVQTISKVVGFTSLAYSAVQVSRQLNGSSAGFSKEFHVHGLSPLSGVAVDILRKNHHGAGSVAGSVKFLFDSEVGEGDASGAHFVKIAYDQEHGINLGGGSEVTLFAINACGVVPVAKLAVEGVASKQAGKGFTNLRKGWSAELALALEAHILPVKLEYPFMEANGHGFEIFGYSFPSHHGGGHHSHTPHPKSKPKPKHH
ncbi:MAG: PASTA domain-containing protein [Rudaea sp.]|uniref:PASTA domain-containing protein n=1 Tax=Rudaea sp. TaxID=2136325 RepID=UPI0039E4EC20